MKITPNKLVSIRYTKSTSIGGTKGEVTERTIVPTYVPPPNIKALDVSELTENQQKYIQDAYAEYAEFYKQSIKNIATFESWLEQSKQESDITNKIKWRTFRNDSIELLE